MPAKRSQNFAKADRPSFIFSLGHCSFNMASHLITRLDRETLARHVAIYLDYNDILCLYNTGDGTLQECLDSTPVHLYCKTPGMDSDPYMFASPNSLVNAPKRLFCASLDCTTTLPSMLLDQLTTRSFLRKLVLYIDRTLVLDLLQGLLRPNHVKDLTLSITKSEGSRMVASHDTRLAAICKSLTLERVTVRRVGHFKIGFDPSIFATIPTLQHVSLRHTNLVDTHCHITPTIGLSSIDLALVESSTVLNFDIFPATCTYLRFRYLSFASDRVVLKGSLPPNLQTFSMKSYNETGHYEQAQLVKCPTTITSLVISFRMASKFDRFCCSDEDRPGISSLVNLQHCAIECFRGDADFAKWIMQFPPSCKSVKFFGYFESTRIVGHALPNHWANGAPSICPMLDRPSPHALRALYLDYQHIPKLSDINHLFRMVPHAETTLHVRYKNIRARSGKICDLWDAITTLSDFKKGWFILNLFGARLQMLDGKCVERFEPASWRKDTTPTV